MDNRKFERRHLNLLCVIRYVTSDGLSVQEAAGRTHDVSRGGIRILAASSLRRHTPVQVCITSPSGPISNFTGVITYSRPFGIGQYTIGVQFCRIHDARASQLLLGASTKDTRADTDETPTADSSAPTSAAVAGGQT